MEICARFSPIYQKVRIISTPGEAQSSLHSKFAHPPETRITLDLITHPILQRDSAAKTAQFTRQSVRAVPVRIISVSKKRPQGIHLLAEEYKQKILQYCAVEDVQVKPNPKNTSNVNAQIEGEDAVMVQHIRPEDWVVMLDENGIDIGSEQMADLLESAGRKGSSRISFCIGGSYGHGPQIRKRADVIIKLSSMVLNHQIALIVLLEQIYRAWTILKGQKYHH